MWGRWGTPQNFLLAFIDELWKTQKIRILKKWKKIAGYILHMSTKNHNHMRYISRDTEWDDFFSFRAIFYPLNLPSPALQPRKPKFWKNEKNIWRCHHFKLVHQKNTVKWCILTQMGSACTDRHKFLSFQAIFALLPHYWPQKLKFGKNVKKHLGVLSFYTCVPLIKIIWCMAPEIWSSTDKLFL